MSVEELDAAKAEEFAGRMMGVINEAAVALSASVGHQTGLFDAMAGLAASTSAEIAEAAGLQERYVREWLGAMVTGGVVDYDRAAKTYALPAEHAAFLTRAAGTDNIAAFATYIPLMGKVENGIITAFREGGGVPYSEFDNFQELQGTETRPVYDSTLIDVTLPLVDGLVHKLKAGIDVADVGCGAGHAINVMAGAFPASRFTGWDFSEEGVELARAEAAELGLANTRFEARDAAQLGETEAFDFITAFDAIHDQARPGQVLKGIGDALRPGGDFLMVDIKAATELGDNLNHPLGPFWYTISTFHCMTVSLALDGEGLGTMWGKEKAVEMLGEAGFTNVDVREVEGDIVNYYYVAKKT